MGLVNETRIPDGARVGENSRAPHAPGMKVLLVEDSDHLRTYVRIALEREGFAVDAAADGVEGRWYAENSSYDVILLDIMLPGLSGLDLLKELRLQGDDTHVLLLTAKDEVADRVRGLQAGADDYLVKPFDLAELVARIQALTRRSYVQKSPVVRIGDLAVDTVAKRVRVGDREIRFTGREYLVLEYLTRRRGEVVSRAEIEEHIYDMNAEIMSNTVNSTISIIRKKLAPDKQEGLLKTHRGLGYSIEE